MARKRPETPATERPRTPGVPLRAIRKLAKEIAEKLRPEKIIPFGSHAYSTPHADSVVDLLVIMAARNLIDQTVRIRRSTEHRFPVDLIVRTPDYVPRGLEGEDWFTREIAGKGKVLHEARDEGMGPQGGGRLGQREAPVRSRVESPQGPA